jgi:hypothetical protein
MTSPTPAWAIKAPDGKILLFDDIGAITLKPYPLSEHEITKGYRCVRVEVMESEEG